MSFQPEQPFHERESRYFLAEILKASDVPLADLVKTIQDRQVVPQWEQMALPNGRSLAACRHQFSLLTNRVSSVLLQPPPLQAHAPAYGRPVQTRPPMGQQPPMMGSEGIYQPQHYQFAPINEPGHPAAFHTAPYNPAETADKTGKKRGRPSKQERELREAEARSRGEIYQPTKRKKAKERPSVEAGEVGAPGEVEGPKKKPRRSDPELEAAGPSPGSYYAGGATMRTTPPDQMQLDTPERQEGGSGTASQVPESPAPRSVPPAIQESIMRSGGRQAASQISSAPPIGSAGQSSAPVLQPSIPENVSRAEQSQNPPATGHES